MAADEKPAVIAYDGSDHAKRAIEQAGAELRTPRKAVVVSAYQPLEALAFWGRPSAIVPEELIEEAGQEAAKTAAEGAELASSVGFDASPMTREEERTWKGILDAAKEAGAGIIVLGSHGRGAVGSAVMGSVATAVAQHANLPVLICRPADAG
jgi:nucleotide-binding universal stress UspA family protein